MPQVLNNWQSLRGEGQVMIGDAEVEYIRSFPYPVYSVDSRPNMLWTNKSTGLKWKQLTVLICLRDGEVLWRGMCDDGRPVDVRCFGIDAQMQGKIAML